MKAICLDMDGTIANLYGVDNWLAKLRACDASPYMDAEPLYPVNDLRHALRKLIDQGWEVRIITWLSKESTKEYSKAVRKSKKAWLSQHNIPYTKAHMVQYGTNKSTYLKQKGVEIGFLWDDDEKVRKSWKLGPAADPATGRLVKELLALAPT